MNSFNQEKSGKHAKLLNQIIKIELDMFKRIKTSEPSLCQEHPKTFEIMREMTHYVLSMETLKSYLRDLQNALKEKRNLLTEKYARMNKLIPQLKSNPIIEKIVDIESNWMNELIQKFPLTFKKRASNFETYLSCELETYSDDTLDKYFRDISDAKELKRNLAEERYSYLFHKIGYKSIKEVEKKSKTNAKPT